jgi:DNA anti-recombination protein RmuC
LNLKGLLFPDYLRGDNVDVKAFFDVGLEEDKENGRQQAKESVTRGLGQVVEREPSRIADETEKATKRLFKGIVRSSGYLYQNICTRLKNLMGSIGEDFHALIAAKGSEDAQIKSRLQQVITAGLRVGTHDNEDTRNFVPHARCLEPPDEILSE